MDVFRILSDGNQMRQATFKGLHKKALGDVGNTLSIKPQMGGKLPAPNVTSEICKKVTNQGSLEFTVHQDEVENCFADACTHCTNPEEDTYEDIRPMSQRLDKTDIECIIQGIFRPPTVFSSPLLSLIPPKHVDDEGFNELSLELEPVKTPSIIDFNECSSDL